MNLFFVLFTLYAAINNACGLQCFQCDSLSTSNNDCREGVQMSLLRECPDKNAKFCRHEISDFASVRDCVSEGESGCTEHSLFGGKITSCLCDKDGCNSSGRSSATFWISLLSVVILLSIILDP